MLEISGTVYYRDGRVESYEGGAPALAAWDDYAIRHAIPQTSGQLDGAPSVLFVLVVLHGLAAVEEGFEVWRRTVLNFDDFEIRDVPPTRQVPGEERSSSLPTFSESVPARSDGFRPATSQLS